MTIALIALIGLVVLGFVTHVMDLRHRAQEYKQHQEGWLYFTLRDEEGSFGSMNNPSARPRGTVFVQQVVNVDEALARAEKELRGSCIKGDKYDGQAVKAYISHLKGEW